MKERGHLNVKFVASNLKATVLPVYEGKKPFKCEICDAKFVKHDLKIHISSVHDERSHLNAKFVLQYLKIHT